MKLQIFMIKKFLSQTLKHTCLAIISLDSALKKVENCYPIVFLKESKYIEKKVVRHFYDNLSYFSSSNEFDEEQISS